MQEDAASSATAAAPAKAEALPEAEFVADLLVLQHLTDRKKFAPVRLRRGGMCRGSSGLGWCLLAVWCAANVLACWSRHGCVPCHKLALCSQSVSRIRWD